MWVKAQKVSENFAHFRCEHVLTWKHRTLKSLMCFCRKVFTWHMKGFEFINAPIGHETVLIDKLFFFCGSWLANYSA